MILIIDTSQPGIGLALDNVVKHVSCEKQSVELSATVEKFLNGNFKDLTAIGVVVGPGSFTGIRLGIAYAKGLSVGLNIPVIPITGFEIYMADAPDAFVAIDSKRGDFFVASAQHAPGVMTIDEVESEQMKCARTVGHKPYDLANALQIVKQKLNANEPVIPMYLKNHYAEKSASVNCECE